MSGTSRVRLLLPPLSWCVAYSPYLVLVKGLDGKKIVQIACGQQHSVALADGGCVLSTSVTSSAVLTGTLHRFVYVWGYNGYCRLGLGNQQDVLMPKLHPHVRRLLSLPRLRADAVLVLVRGADRGDDGRPHSCRPGVLSCSG